MSGTDPGRVTVNCPGSGVALLTLERPEARGALSLAMLDELAAAVGAVEADPEVRCVVLAGTPGSFSAGLDLVELERHPAALLHHDGPQRLRRLATPVVAAIDGPAVTGGLELALAADVRLGSPRARFADTHALVGLVPGWGLSTALPALVGPSQARLLSLTGRFVGAEEALRIGLLDVLVADDDVVAHAVALAVTVAAADARAVAGILGLYRAASDDAVAAADARERELFATWVADLDPSELAARREALLRPRRPAQTSTATTPDGTGGPA